MRYSTLACDYDGTLACDGSVDDDTLRPTGPGRYLDPEAAAAAADTTKK